MDHNALLIGTGKTAYQIYNTCQANFTMDYKPPEGTFPKIKSQKDGYTNATFDPNHVVTMTELGWNYLYCSRWQGAHCRLNLKAKVYVFEDCLFCIGEDCEKCNYCPIHTN